MTVTWLDTSGPPVNKGFDMKLLRLCAAVLTLLSSIAAHAEPVVPTSDEQVVEVLPALNGNRAEERRLRREWSANPADVGKSVALARRYLDQARSEGDPRRAGLALAALQTWPDVERAPDEVLLMAATIEQYLHDFDRAASHLEHLVKRRPEQAQAWLTLATVRRVQGRYAQSDAACDALAPLVSLYAQACRAENQALRGDFDGARDTLMQLVRQVRGDADARNWLLTTLAETQSRAARFSEAEAAYRMALAARRDAYTIMSYADFLILQQRPADALELLKDEPRNDAMLLRVAIAGTLAKTPNAARDAREMRERMRLASERPDAKDTHAREQAMFALWVDASPERALKLARINVKHQREPLDLMVLAVAARATGDPRAIAQADALRQEMDLHDRRLDASL